MIYSNEGNRVATLVVSSAAVTTPSPTYAGATPEVIPELSVAITAQGTHVSIQFDGTFEIQPGDVFEVSIYRDGVAMRTRRIGSSALVGTQWLPVRIHAFRALETPGAHTYDVRWSIISGTARAYDVQRDLAVVEVPATMVA